jgi:hypothetical protein
MTLRDETWTPCSLDEVVDQFMRAAEPKIREELVALAKVDCIRQLNKRLQEVADLNDPNANRERMEMLKSYHAGLIDAIPSDTEWFRVAFLRDAHLDELRVISVWAEAKQAHGKLEAVVALRQQKGEPLPQMRGTPEQWGASYYGAIVLTGRLRSSMATIAWLSMWRRSIRSRSTCPST